MGNLAHSQLDTGSFAAMRCSRPGDGDVQGECCCPPAACGDKTHKMMCQCSVPVPSGMSGSEQHRLADRRVGGQSGSRAKASQVLRQARYMPGHSHQLTRSLGSSS